MRNRQQKPTERTGAKAAAALGQRIAEAEKEKLAPQRRMAETFARPGRLATKGR